MTRAVPAGRLLAAGLIAWVPGAELLPMAWLAVRVRGKFVLGQVPPGRSDKPGRSVIPGLVPWLPGRGTLAGHGGRAARSGHGRSGHGRIGARIGLPPAAGRHVVTVRRGPQRPEPQLAVGLS